MHILTIFMIKTIVQNVFSKKTKFLLYIMLPQVRSYIYMYVLVFMSIQILISVFPTLLNYWSKKKNSAKLKISVQKCTITLFIIKKSKKENISSPARICMEDGLIN